MSDWNVTSRQDSVESVCPESVADAVAATETYETEEGTVFYDSENPLAWIQAAETVPLTDAA